MIEPLLAPAAPDVVAESFDGETVVVHLGTGCYYAFDAAAGAIWTLLTPGRSVTETIELAQAQHGLEPRVVREFIEGLRSEDLLCETETAAPSTTPDAVALVGPPSFERFTDMQDLLLVDPVHDIALDGDGWPLAEPATG